MAFWSHWTIDIMFYVENHSIPKIKDTIYSKWRKKTINKEQNEQNKKKKLLKMREQKAKGKNYNNNDVERCVMHKHIIHQYDIIDKQNHCTVMLAKCVLCI